MGKAILEITAEFLMQLLKLEDYYVRDARHNASTGGGGILEIVVEHDSIPETKYEDNYTLLPFMRPIYSRQGESIKLEDVKFYSGSGEY